MSGFQLPPFENRQSRTQRQLAAIASGVSQTVARKKAQLSKPWVMPTQFAGIYITECRFPLWKDKVNHRYCGKPTTGGCSYCDHHHTICYQPGTSYAEMERLRKRRPAAISPPTPNPAAASGADRPSTSRAVGANTSTGAP